MGGISGEQQAPCGAVSASAVCLGIRHRWSLSDKEKAKQSRTIVRNHSSKLARDFQEKFGNITCAGLLGIDFSKPSAYQEFRDSGVWKDKCNKYIEFIVEKLYEFEDGKGPEETA